MTKIVLNDFDERGTVAPGATNFFAFEIFMLNMTRIAMYRTNPVMQIISGIHLFI